MRTAAPIIIGALALGACSGEPGGDVPAGTSEAIEQTAAPVEFDTDVELPPATATGLVVTWETPGETLHIYTSGSSTPGCYPEPIDAWTDGASVEITYDPADTSLSCALGVHSYGWEVTWDEPFEVPGTMPLRLMATRGDRAVTITLPPEPTAPLA